MSEPERVIMVAVPVESRIRQLERTRPRQALAVNDAIDRIGVTSGRRIDLPTADPVHPYYALRTSDPDAPVVIYREMSANEDGDWLVVSLMSPEQYRQQKADEQSGLLNDPAVREEIRVVAGTAATIAARAISGTVTTGGAAPTTGPDAPRTTS